MRTSAKPGWAGPDSRSDLRREIPKPLHDCIGLDLRRIKDEERLQREDPVNGRLRQDPCRDRGAIAAGQPTILVRVVRERTRAPVSRGGGPAEDGVGDRSRQGGDPPDDDEGPDQPAEHGSYGQDRAGAAGISTLGSGPSSEPRQPVRLFLRRQLVEYKRMRVAFPRQRGGDRRSPSGALPPPRSGAGARRRSG